MIIKKMYSINLTTVDPFRIGGKSDPLSEAENPVAVVGGRVYVPGPSLKGAFRGELERFLNDSYYDNFKKAWPEDKLHLQPCIPATKLTNDEERLVKENHFKGSGCHYPCDIGPKGKCGKSLGESHSICPICYLLGAQGLVGFVQVPFLFTDIRYDELYSARLERTSQTVVSGTNRPYQLVPPESKFTGVLEVLISDNLLGWELGKARLLKESTKGDSWLNNGKWTQDEVLKDFIKNRIEAITGLGGYRSKGFGRVEIKTQVVKQKISEN
jgi:CRISPR/Cas system CSM-associated protein Csm3 (group 7 of RAMP superfamily)